MASTYVLISSNVLGSTTASVTFSSIPQTYTDLVLRCSTRDDTGNQTNSLYFEFNNTSTVYSKTEIAGYGGSASSLAFSNSAATGLNFTSTSGGGSTANTFGSIELYIPSYTVSQNKPYSSFFATENNSTLARIGTDAFLYRSTTAISTITITVSGANFVANSSFYLYGIKNS